MKKIALLVVVVLLSQGFNFAFATKINRWWHSNFTPIQILSSDHTQNMPLLSGGYLTWLDSRNRFHDAEGRIMPRLFMKNLDIGEEKPCSAFSRKSVSRTMFRNTVVWAEAQTTQSTDDNFDIVMYDFATGIKKNVCTERKRQDSPQISKDWIIWKDWRNSQSWVDEGSDFEVYGYEQATGKEFLIMGNSYHGTAELFGEYTALSIKTPEKSDYDIYLFVMSSKRLVPICTAPGDQLAPKVIGNTVLWLDCRSCDKFSQSKNPNVMSYSLSTKKEKSVTSQTTRDFGLTAGDRYAAWFNQPKTGFAGAVSNNIRGYDTVSGKIFDITEKPGMYSNISVSGKYCIFEYTDPTVNLGCDIYVFDFSTEKTWCVFKGTGDQRNPRVYGDYAVWEDQSAYDSESVTIWGTSLKNPQVSKEPASYGQTPSDIWSTMRGDNQRTGISHSNIKNIPQNPFYVQWKIEFTDSVYSSPVFNKKGFAFVGTDEKKFYSINVYDGSKEWEFQTIGRVRSSATIYKDRVFFGDDKGVFYCLDMCTGQEIWHYQTGGSIQSSPVAFQNDADHYGGVAIVSFDKKLYLFNALSKTATLKWTLDLGGWSINAPAVDYNPLIKTSDGEVTTKVLYVCTSNNRVLCISASSGRIIAQYQTKTSVESTPVSFGSRVLVSSNDGILSGMDFSVPFQEPYITNREETNHPLTASAIFEPCSGSLFFESSSGTIKCCQDKTIWSYNLGEPIKVPPAMLEGWTPNSTVMVIGSDAGKLVFLDGSTGKELVKMDFKSSISAAPAIYDTGYPAIIFGTVDRKLYCVSQRPLVDEQED